MRTALRLVLALFGAVCSIIAISHVAIGPRAIPGGVVTNAVMDSEDRFYATLFLGFGVGIIWCAGNLERRDKPLAALLIVFFAGGIARIMSVLSVGLPGPVFIILGTLELVLPPLFWWWLMATRPQADWPMPV